MRRRIVAGNWKMNLDLPEAESLVKELKDSIGDPACEVVIAPPFYFLDRALSALRGTTVKVSAQNCHHEKKGAFTGEVSASMLKSLGCRMVILGHSERRQFNGETDELLLQKIHRALEAGLEVIFCIGESSHDRESGKQNDIVRKQLVNTVFLLEKTAAGKLVIAYEPVWAIGTGKTASPEQAQEMHAFIRSLFAEKYGKDIAAELCILYGGSCNASNAGFLFGQPDIDGGLIGGASLKAPDFLSVIQACR